MAGFNAAFVILLGLFGLPSLWSPGPAANKQGNKDYQKGKYDQAVQQYQKAQAQLPAEKILALNSGTALLGAGKTQEALSSLLSAAADPRPAVQARAFYNAGNALSDTKKLEEALDTYRRSILADPKDEDAKFNYELTKRRLEQKKKDDEKKKDQKNDKNDKNDKNKDQNKDQQDKDKQSDDQKNKDQQPKDQPPPDPDQQKPPDQPPGAPEEPQQPGMMSKQEAERLLDALKDNEIKQLKEKLKSKRRKNVEKDW